jgi:16S rRNA processing protein RimM
MRKWKTLTEFEKIGRTKKSHGKNGELRLDIELHFLSTCLSAEFLFLDLDGNIVPFAVDFFRDVGDILVKFLHIDSLEKASKLVDVDIYIPSMDINTIPVTESKLHYTHLEGYTMFDEQEIQIGVIDVVREFPEQEMAVIFRNNKEILVPLHADLIVKVDHEKNTVTVSIPDGLLEL